MGQIALTGLCIILDPDVRRRWIGTALLVTGLAAVMMTGSRTSLIAFAAAAVLVTFLWARRNARRVFIFGISFIVMIGCLELVARLADPEASPINSVLGLLERPRDEGNIAALTGRTDVWDTCIRIAMDHPLTGYGFESFWTPIRILEISSIHQWAINQAHSVYIEHLVSLGFIGLGLWCILIFGSLGVSLRKYAIDRSPTTLWLAGIVVFCIVHGFNESINMLPVFNGYLFIVVIAHLVLYRKPRSVRVPRATFLSHTAHIDAPRFVA
ncbi:MAG: O-antigen ligase family protein [Rhodospirillales bacterium]|nr:O-antigen ligase family protein [Rhodospirillales bacterium]